MRPIQRLAAHLWPTFRRHQLNMARRIKNGEACWSDPGQRGAQVRFHVRAARYWHLLILRERVDSTPNG